MRALGARELLNVWERSADAPWLARAQNLLLAADSELSSESFEALRVGEMDRRLLQLRRAIFGSEARCITRCEACGVDVDFSIPTDQLFESSASPVASVRCFKFNDYDIRLRSPTVRDLAALSQWGSDENQRRSLVGAAGFLLECCVTELKSHGAEASLTVLPEEAVDAIESELEAMDPQSNCEITMACPDCGVSMSRTFEILPFMWEELTAWVRRIFGQIHRLALAYGWSEADILLMSDRRRAVYLEMIGTLG